MSVQPAPALRGGSDKEVEMNGELYGTRDVARMVRLSSRSLLYRLSKGDVPEASYRVSGRRVFTEDDVRRIRAELAALRWRQHAAHRGRRHSAE
jgi:hypothetical protein